MLSCIKVAGLEPNAPKLFVGKVEIFIARIMEVVGCQRMKQLDANKNRRLPQTTASLIPLVLSIDIAHRFLHSSQLYSLELVVSRIIPIIPIIPPEKTFVHTKAV
jgi:hypothetical protein